MSIHKGKILEKVKGANVLDCSYCGFIHLDPIPLRRKVESLYQGKYYSKEKPLYIKRNIQDETWWQSIFHDRLETINKYLETNERKLLEFGSGPGLFLDYAQKKGWGVLGIEPAPIAFKYSLKRGVRVINALVEDINIKELGLFDCVALFEVLEHVAYAKKTLAIANKLLKAGGIICISIPNEYNPLQIVFKKSKNIKNYWLAPPLHINYFTNSSITKLLVKCGFKIVYREASFPMEFFLLMGDNYLGNDKLGRFMHGKRKKFDILLSKYNNPLKRNLYRSFAELGIGRSITIYGRKVK